jgi:metal-dependent amidase/aminoacylase/carboxypeptidase family protein
MHPLVTANFSQIHETPELGYEEFKAHDNIVALLRAQEFDVTPHAHGLETLFLTEYGSGWSSGRF